MRNLLADLVVRFNAAMTRNVEFFFVPHSSLNLRVVKVLYNNRCISTFSCEIDPFDKSLCIKIVPFFVMNRPLVRSIELMSTSGLRMY